MHGLCKNCEEVVNIVTTKIKETCFFFRSSPWKHLRMLIVVKEMLTFIYFNHFILLFILMVGCSFLLHSYSKPISSSKDFLSVEIRRIGFQVNSRSELQYFVLKQFLPHVSKTGKEFLVSADKDFGFVLVPRPCRQETEAGRKKAKSRRLSIHCLVLLSKDLCSFGL